MFEATALTVAEAPFDVVLYAIQSAGSCLHCVLQIASNSPALISERAVNSYWYSYSLALHPSALGVLLGVLLNCVLPRIRRSPCDTQSAAQQRECKGTVE